MRAGLLAGPSVLSFSPIYFRREWGIGYQQIAPSRIEDVPGLISELGWQGFNVTTPYKETILHFVSHLRHPVDKIQAANTIVIEPDGSWTAYNTDYEAARDLLASYMEVYDPWEEAWVLGTGGAARAVAWAHAELFPQKPLYFFSREAGKAIPFPHPHEVFGYESALSLLTDKRKLIIQATPLGGYPNPQAMPPLPLSAIQPQDIVWDLIYNINPTIFLQEARKKGCSIESGMALFKNQAQKSMDYWFSAYKARHKTLSSRKA